MLKTFTALNKLNFYFKKSILNQKSFDFMDVTQNEINLIAGYIYILEDSAELET